MTLIIVRHAHAGSRSDWLEKDEIRPLSPRGTAQANALVDVIAPLGPTRILSSRAVRCVQTVDPLARQLGTTVETDDRLFEGNGRSAAAALLAEFADVDAVLCSHGDVIPTMLRLLVEAGMDPDRSLVWQKASTWIVERSDGSWAAGRYLPPPA